MAHDPLEGPLRDLAQLGALALGATALALLGLALAGELLRAHRRAPAFQAVLEQWLPGVARTAAVALLAGLTMCARPAAADDGVRGWLREGGASPTTVTRPAVATPDSLDRRAEPPVQGPVVLAPRPAVPEVPAAVPAPAIVYRVVPGDCLWSIAARHLGAGATNQAIDRAWRAIYAANRAAVGSDPGLIHPGLALSLPPLEP